jgi:hypothetical protein
MWYFSINKQQNEVSKQFIACISRGKNCSHDYKQNIHLESILPCLEKYKIDWGVFYTFWVGGGGGLGKILASAHNVENKSCHASKQ